MQDITLFFEKLAGIINSNLPFVVYRKPNEDLVTVVVQNNSKKYNVDNFTECGFMFAPFHKKGEKILFPEQFTTKFSIVLNDKNVLDINTDNTKIEAISNLAKAKEQHVLLTEKSMKYIQHNEAEKIVISRKEDIRKNDFQVLNSYKKMLNSYKNAMVYLWFHPSVGCWMGASPERLIHIHKNEFKTMALAGTQSYVDTTNVIWKPKELQEQQFVTDYIINTVKNVINFIKISDSYTVKAGSLLHIRTDITGKLKSEKMVSELIKSLHPTPAVCGLPKQTASDFILENEGYDRKYYTGYLGELNINNESNLYVNLRCMEIISNIISIYIGGGITKDSNAEKEWSETIFKSEIMKSIL